MSQSAFDKRAARWAAIPVGNGKWGLYDKHAGKFVLTGTYKAMNTAWRAIVVDGDLAGRVAA
jgi:hypothetical protein